MNEFVAEQRGKLAVGTYAALSLRYRVTASTPHLADEFARLYRSCAATTADATVDLDIDLDAGAGDDDDRLVVAMTEIDGASVRASAADVVILHAAAVCRDHGEPVLLVGPSGAGKSTLSAALTAHGWTYLGDEAVGLDSGATELFANPKPWKLDRRSRAALADGGWPRLARDADREILVAPQDLGAVHAPGAAGRPAAIVGVRFREGARSDVAPMSRADGAELLADQCFNFAQWGARALDTVAALARHAPALQLEFGDLPSAVAALEDALR